MSGTPRPAGDVGVVYRIGGAILADGTGRRVINCIAEWSGGMNVDCRYDQTNPVEVAYAAAWAVERRALWRASGFPVRDADEVIRTFT